MSAEIISIYSYSLDTTITFKAYITEFSDAFSSAWKTENIYGKMDAIATFQNTTRKISLGFDIPNADIGESITNHTKINNLISGLYPIYNDDAKEGIATIGSPPFFRIKYANMIHNPANPSVGLLCYLDSGFTYTPDYGSGVFTDGENIYPKLFKASLGLTVIHEHALGSNAEHKSRLDAKDANREKFPYNIKKNITDSINTSLQQAKKAFEEVAKNKTQEAMKAQAEGIVGR